MKEVIVRMPASLDEVAEFVAQIGSEKRAIEQVYAELNAAVDALKAGAMTRSGPHEKKIEQLFLGILAFGQEHRDVLTEHGQRKTIKLLTGDFGWRMNPPSVHITNNQRVLAKLKELGLEEKFIRTVEEVNKEAMLQKPDEAKRVPGVSIKKTESFFVRPTVLTVDIEREIPVE